MMQSVSTSLARTLVSSLACGVLAACATPAESVGSGTVVLSVRPSLYLRVTPDSDATELVGGFIPDNVADGDVDESQAMRTRCSCFITAKRVPASGEFREVTAASQGASGKVGVKSIARLDMGTSQSQALLVKYSLLEKMQSSVDEDGLAQCCAADPDQCTRRSIAGALMADGEYFAAIDRATGANGDGSAAVQGVPVDASFMYSDDLKWQRQASFKRQYFAFNIQRSGMGNAAAAPPPPGVARFVKDQRWCGPTETASPSGVKNTMKVLAFFPNTERKAAALAAIRSILEVRKSQGGATGALEQMLRDIEVQP